MFMSKKIIEHIMKLLMNVLTYFLLLFILIFSSCTGSRDESNQPESPNIVLILADDMGYGDPGSYNSQSKIPTPHIDNLANHGIMFTDAHSPGAWCVPSRYGLLTGRYPGRVKMNWTEQALLDKDQETLATMLKRNGYATACIGKWHLGYDNLNWDNPEEIDTLRGGPDEHGFDYFYGMHASLDIPPYFYIENNIAVQPPTGWVDDNQSEDATTPISGAFWREGRMSPDFSHEEVLPAFTEKAQGFIEQHVAGKTNAPFFLYFPLTAPHTPWLPKSDWEGESEAGEYGDFVMQVDEVVGQIKNTLMEQGIENNTLIIFTSDNGPVWFERDVNKFNHQSTDGLKGMKLDYWEGGSRIPFIASWPGKIPEKQVSDHLLCFTDLMATFAAIVGDTLNGSFDSYNQWAVMTGNQTEGTVRNELIIQDKIYRESNWKYIHGTGLGVLSRKFDPDSIYLDALNNEGELYNLEDDPQEQTNLFHQHQSKADSMKQRMNQILSTK